MARVTAREAFAAIRADAGTYADWRFSTGFWVTVSYRVRHLRKFGSTFCKLLLPVDLTLGGLRWLVADSKIPASCMIGPGLSLPHPSGVILNDNVVIGANVRIFQQVTIGTWQSGTPTIEDGCSIYGGAKVFGPIRIGQHARIGPNSVVANDIPAYANVQAAPFTLSSRPGTRSPVPGSPDDAA